MTNPIIADISIFKPGPDEAPTAAFLVLFRPNGDRYLTTTIIMGPEKIEEVVKFFEGVESE